MGNALGTGGFYTLTRNGREAIALALEDLDLSAMTRCCS